MKLSHYFKKTFSAIENHKETIVKVYPDIIFEAEKMLESNQKVNYVGVKNTDVIPYDLVKEIKLHGYLHHTDDKMSDFGRAIDLNLINPITTRFMTGSSSGTALNVFYDINDVGIGSDGGGSVLAPAISLNLIGFISPLIYRDYTKKFSKTSTDGITFSPSIGFISKKIELIKDLVEITLKSAEEVDLDILVSKPKFEIFKNLYAQTRDLGSSINLSYNSFSRKSLMQDLREVDFSKNILVSFEGPVDVKAYGDSIMGHYSSESKNNQRLGGKYYLTVVNMLNLSAVIIPSYSHGCGILLICKSDASHIKSMLNLAQKLVSPRSKLEEGYFSIHKWEEFYLWNIIKVIHICMSIQQLIYQELKMTKILI